MTAGIFTEGCIPISAARRVKSSLPGVRASERPRPTRFNLKVPGTDVQVWTSNYLSVEQHQRRSSRHPTVLSHVDGGSRN